MEETKADTVGFSQKRRYSDSDSDSDSDSQIPKKQKTLTLTHWSPSNPDLEVDEKRVDDLKYKDDNHLTVLTYNKPEKLLENLSRIFIQSKLRGYDYTANNNYPDIILLQEISDYITNYDDTNVAKGNMKTKIIIGAHRADDIIIPFKLEISLQKTRSENILNLFYYGYYARVSKKSENLYKSLVTLIKCGTQKTGESLVTSGLVINNTDVHEYCTYRKMCQDTDYTCTEGFGYSIKCYSGSDIQVNPTHVIRGVLIVPVEVDGKKINIANTHMTHNRKKQIFINYLAHILSLNKSFIFGGDMNIDFNKENEKKEFNHYEFFTGLPQVKFHRTKTRTIGKTKEGSGSILDWFVTSCDIECKSILKQLPATITTEDHYKVFANFKLDYEHNAGEYEYSSAKEQIKKQIEALNSEEEEIRRFIQNYQKNTCLLDPTKTDIILQEYISNFKGVGELANYSLDKLKEYCREKHIQKYSSLNKDALIDFILDYQSTFEASYNECKSSGSPSLSPSPPVEFKAPVKPKAKSVKTKAKSVKPILEELKAPTPGEPFEVSPYKKLNKYNRDKLLAYCQLLEIECPGIRNDIIKSIIFKEKSMLEKYESSPSPPVEFSSSDVDMG